MGGERPFAAGASLDCLSGECRHSDKYINGASFCGVEGGSEPTVDVTKSRCTRSQRKKFCVGVTFIAVVPRENWSFMQVVARIAAANFSTHTAIASVNNATVEGAKK
jgi:hypothetical protein